MQAQQGLRWRCSISVYHVKARTSAAHPSPKDVVQHRRQGTGQCTALDMLGQKPHV